MTSDEVGALRKSQSRSICRAVVVFLGVCLSGCASLSEFESVHLARGEPRGSGAVLSGSSDSQIDPLRDWSNVVSLPQGTVVVVAFREGTPARVEIVASGSIRETLQLPARRVRGVVERANEQGVTIVLPDRGRVRIGRSDIGVVWKVEPWDDSLRNGVLLGLVGALGGGLLTAAAIEDFTFSAPGAWVFVVGIGAGGAALGAVIDRAKSSEIRTRIYE